MSDNTRVADDNNIRLGAGICRIKTLSKDLFHLHIKVDDVRRLRSALPK
ncbi:hypothetical protein [Bifidobacterium sp.]|nr:hypothetical protein [Bifidobacterium sp.]MCI1636302.1 hypothetical protein [Bifidobacterium sp.]